MFFKTSFRVTRDGIKLDIECGPSFAPALLVALLIFASKRDIDLATLLSFLGRLPR